MAGNRCGGGVACCADGPDRRLRLRVGRPGPGVGVLGVSGEIDMTEAGAVQDGLVEMVRSAGTELVVLDLSEVSFLGSHGLAAVVHGHRAAAELGRTLRGVTGEGNRAVSRPIAMTGLDWVIDWYPRLADAVAGAGARCARPPR